MDKNRDELKLILINSAGIPPYCSYYVNGNLVTVHAEEFSDSKTARSADRLAMALRKISINHSMKECNLIAVTTGPGSFTGIRIGISLAKGIAAALGIKIIPVSNFDLLLNRCSEIPEKCVLLIHSKADEYYYSFYDNAAETKSGYASINEIIRYSERDRKIVADLDNECLIKHSYLDVINLRNSGNESDTFLKLALKNTHKAVSGELVQALYIKDFIVKSNALV